MYDREIAFGAKATRAIITIIVGVIVIGAVWRLTAS